MRKQRTFQEMREISFETNINLHAEGSCLVKFGNTHVLCTASIDEKTPPWLRNSGKGLGYSRIWNASKINKHKNRS